MLRVQSSKVRKYRNGGYPAVGKNEHSIQYSIL
jgi:hypothetical protein